jgi:dephospho-CoA kinase
VLRVGLSGGIGAGKSAVSGFLRECGAVVVDADRLAREVVEPGTPGLAAVAAEFGPDVLQPDGALDRAALAGRVFGDAGARRRLEGIVHPLVGQRTGELLAAAPPDAVVVHDVPLLVEKQMGPAYHLVVLVGAPEDVRLARLVDVRGMPEVDARARIAAQADDDARRAAADVWLDNSGDLPALATAVGRLWTERLRPYEENVRLHRPARRPVPGAVPYDPTWPAQAERVRARLALAAGPLAASVEHVGPTAVPGRDAEDVLGLRLTLAGGTGADDIRAQLEDAGFPRVEGAASTPGETRHASADPGRPVDLVVAEGPPAG